MNVRNTFYEILRTYSTDLKERLVRAVANGLPQ